MFAGVQNIEQRQYTPTLKASLTTAYARSHRAVYTGKKVVDTGALTIEEVITADGKRAYLAISRNQKRMYENDLKKIRKDIEKELARIGSIKNRSEYDKAKYATHREAIRARQLAYYHKTKHRYAERKDVINARRRERYAAKKAMKVAMADMSETT